MEPPRYVEYADAIDQRRKLDRSPQSRTARGRRRERSAWAARVRPAARGAAAARALLRASPARARRLRDSNLHHPGSTSSIALASTPDATSRSYSRPLSPPCHTTSTPGAPSRSRGPARSSRRPCAVRSHAEKKCLVDELLLHHGARASSPNKLQHDRGARRRFHRRLARGGRVNRKLTLRGARRSFLHRDEEHHSSLPRTTKRTRSSHCAASSKRREARPMRRMRRSYARANATDATDAIGRAGKTGGALLTISPRTEPSTAATATRVTHIFIVDPWCIAAVMRSRRFPPDVTSAQVSRGVPGSSFTGILRRCRDRVDWRGTLKRRDGAASHRRTMTIPAGIN